MDFHHLSGIVKNEGGVDRDRAREPAPAVLINCSRGSTSPSLTRRICRESSGIDGK